MLTSAKLRGPWYKKVYFLKLNLRVYLRAKFQVSSITLTTFRQAVILPSPHTHAHTHTHTHTHTNTDAPESKTLKGSPILGLTVEDQYSINFSRSKRKFLFRPAL